MVKEVTDAVEEYLECIYRLQLRDGVARTSEMVRLLNVVPGTITNTVKRLEKAGLVNHEPYKGVKLTKRGRKLALDVLRRHRLSERLLTDVLGVEWAEAHKAACQLEHALTDDVVNKLDEVLEHPKTCPHGNPIPTKSGDVIEEKSDLLTDLKIHDKGIVAKVEQEEPELLKYLDALDLRPGSYIIVEEKAPFNAPITIKVGDKLHPLGRDIASKIWIRK